MGFIIRVPTRRAGPGRLQDGPKVTQPVTSRGTTGAQPQEARAEAGGWPPPAPGRKRLHGTSTYLTRDPVPTATTFTFASAVGPGGEQSFTCPFKQLNS